MGGGYNVIKVCILKLIKQYFSTERLTSYVKLMMAIQRHKKKNNESLNLTQKALTQKK